MTRDEIIKIHKRAIDAYALPGLNNIFTESSDTTRAVKGFVINQGYCGNYAHFLVSKLGTIMDHNRIKVYEWSPVHVVVTVDDSIILDAEYPDGIEFNRNNLNTLFLSHASRLAVSLQEYYYIKAKNRVAIVYDPWGFVDNQDFDHIAIPIVPSIETVLTAEQLLNQGYGQLTLGRLIRELQLGDIRKPVYFSDDKSRPCGVVLYAKTGNELAIEYTGDGNENEESIPTAEALLCCLTAARDREFTALDGASFKVDCSTGMLKANFGNLSCKLIVDVVQNDDSIELVVKTPHELKSNFKSTT